MGRARRSTLATTVLICGSLVAGCATVRSRPKATPPADPPAGLVTAASDTPSPAPHYSGTERNFVLPIVEIVLTDSLLNLAGRKLYTDGYSVTGRSIARNLKGPWVIDDDPFQVNQFLHPYQGALYHASARASGLNYWQSLAYTFGGSALWEIAGETTAPSMNDQVASGIAGTFLGEALFRMARQLIEHRGSPGFWRVLGATVISPPAGVNHAIFGESFHSDINSAGRSSDVRLQFGALAEVSRAGSSTSFDTPAAAFAIEYGFPGRTTYLHRRPFDYFSAEASASTGNKLDALTTRGLLIGREYQAGREGRGVWGLYGNYEYLAPAAFRLSTTGVAFGATAQRWWSRSLAVQSSALAGVGYSAAQNIDGASETDYHYGLAPEVILSTKLIAGRRASFDLTARGWYVTAIGSFQSGAHDLIGRADAAVSVRLFDRHAVSVTYTRSRRRAFFVDTPILTQSSRTLGVYYTILASGGFGAIR